MTLRGDFALMFQKKTSVGAVKVLKTHVRVVHNLQMSLLFSLNVPICDVLVAAVIVQAP